MSELATPPNADSHWLNRERLTTYPRIMLGLYLLITLIWVLMSHHGVDPSGKPLGHDFIAFWSASKLALAGDPLGAYDLKALVETEQALVPGIQTAHPWQYPPNYLLLVLPFALLPYLLSYGVFVSATFAGFALILRRIAPARVGLIFLLAFPGTFQNALHGQNGFLTAMLMGAGLLWLPSRPLLAGAMFGLLTIKPHLGLLIPLALICSREWQALVSATVVAIAFLGLSLVVLGSATLGAFIERMPEVAGWVANNQLPLPKVPTFFSFARLLELPTPWAYALHFAVAFPVTLTVCRVWMRCRDHGLRAASLCSGSLLISPYLFDYDLVWLALPLAWFAAQGLRHGWQRSEREWLLVAWLLPAFVAVLYQAVRVQLAPFAMLGFFVVIARRALATRTDAEG